MATNFIVKVRDITDADLPPEAAAEASVAGVEISDLVCCLESAPAAGAIIIRVPFVRTVVFPANMNGSRAVCEYSPAASATFSVKKNGTTFSTFTFPAGLTSATLQTPWKPSSHLSIP